MLNNPDIVLPETEDFFTIPDGFKDLDKEARNALLQDSSVLDFVQRLHPTKRGGVLFRLKEQAHARWMNCRRRLANADLDEEQYDEEMRNAEWLDMLSRALLDMYWDQLGQDVLTMTATQSQAARPLEAAPRKATEDSAATLDGDLRRLPPKALSMPIIDHGKDYTPTLGPGGRMIPGWMPRRFCYPDQSLAPTGNRDMLGQQMSGLIQEANARVSDRFIIIERSHQHFMQCLCTEGGWLLEKREGNEERHLRALAPGKRSQDICEDQPMRRIIAPPNQLGMYLGQDQVAEAMSSYLLAEPEPEWLEWERLEL